MVIYLLVSVSSSVTLSHSNVVTKVISFNISFTTMKIIFDKTLYNESDADTTVVTYANDYVFRRVDICRTDNQCLVYTLNVFYKDVGDLKKASAL